MRIFIKYKKNTGRDKFVSILQTLSLIRDKQNKRFFPSFFFINAQNFKVIFLMKYEQIVYHTVLFIFFNTSQHMSKTFTQKILGLIIQTKIICCHFWSSRIEDNIHIVAKHFVSKIITTKNHKLRSC